MHHQRVARPAAFALSLVLVGSLAAACSSSSGSAALGKDPIGAALAATKKAGSGRISGTMAGPPDTTPGRVDGAFAGDLAGRGTARVEFVTKNNKKLPTRLLWTNRTFYFTRSIATLPASDSLSIFARTANFKPWRKVTVTGGAAQLIPSAFSPTALLAWLDQINTPVTTHAGEKVGGTKTTRITTTNPIVIGVWTGATVNLWVDSHNRVVRVGITSPGGGTQYDVSNYGTSVEATPPAANQIATASELAAIVPAEPFKTVASGTTNGITWSLQRVAGTQRTTCWRWQANVPLVQQNTTKGVRCLRPPTNGSPEDTVQFPVFGNGQSSYDALAVSMPAGVKKLTLGFVGGKTQELPLSNPLVWVGPNSPIPAFLGVTLKDGTKIDCGAGAVTTAEDLTNPAFTSQASSAAWACLPDSDT